MMMDFLTQIKMSVEELNEREINGSDRGKSNRAKRKIDDEEEGIQDSSSQDSKRGRERVVGVQMRLKNRRIG